MILLSAMTMLALTLPVVASAQSFNVLWYDHGEEADGAGLTAHLLARGHSVTYQQDCCADSDGDNRCDNRCDNLDEGCGCQTASGQSSQAPLALLTMLGLLLWLRRARSFD